MKQVLSTLILGRCRSAIFYETRRFAGHSKWSNIKHDKAIADHQRNLKFNNLKLKMRVAIAEGGSFKPNLNPKLQQVIDLAKTANMPRSSIENFLKKFDPSQVKSDESIIEARGPGGCLMLIHVNTPHLEMVKSNIRSKLRKHGGRVEDRSLRNAFDHICVAVVEKDRDLNQATEDAILVGADDVQEEEQDNKSYFVFQLNPQQINRITGELRKLNYTINAIEEEWIPNREVELDENSIKNVEKLRKKLFEMPEIERIDDNIV